MSKLELTILKFIYTEVLQNMMLSIGDMRRNGIQQHAPPHDPYVYSVKFVCYCMSLFLSISTCFSTY